MLTKYEAFLDADNALWGYYAKNNSCEKHFHRRIELSYVESGTKTVTVGNSTFSVGAGDIVYIPQYYPHQYSDSEDCSDYIFCIPVTAISDLHDVFKKNVLPLVMQDRSFNTEEILPLLKSFFRLVKSENILVVHSYTNIIFSSLFNHYKQSVPLNVQDFGIATDILHYIEEHFNEDITLESLALHFNYNKFYFSKFFNKQFNVNLKRYLNSVRSQHFISELRKNPDRNVTDLIFESGFSSTSTFYHFFYENYNKSPKELLKEL